MAARAHRSGISYASFVLLKNIVDGRITAIPRDDTRGWALLRRALVTRLGRGVRATPEGVALVAAYRADPEEHTPPADMAFGGPRGNRKPG